MSTGAATPPVGEPASDQVNRVVERLASRITETGMPKMRARVLAALITSPDGALTAIELGQRLSISSGAVSTAVRSLVSVGLITREYVPGSRRDVYRVRDDPWPEVFNIRSQWLLSFAASAEAAIGELGELPDGPAGAGARLAEMREFSLFVVPKLEEIVTAWRAHRAAPG